jgi:hypothetical protein
MMTQTMTPEKEFQIATSPNVSTKSNWQVFKFSLALDQVNPSSYANDATVGQKSQLSAPET